MSLEGEIQLLAVIVAVACALPGTFLLLRRMSLLSDAIGHAMLLGIVLAFLVVRTLDSPLPILGAALAGVVTVWLIEALTRTRLVREDAAIGLVFPFLFSIGVILVSRGAAGVHLDTDAVLLGELALAPFRRWIVGGTDLGPVGTWTMGGILLLNLLFITLLWKELKLSTFDSALAASLGFSPLLLHYLLSTMVSVTAVGAFDSVGAILVVALMIVPPATARLLSDRYPVVLGLAVVIGALSALLGFRIAWFLDASIAGSMAASAGLLFLLAFLFAPGQGIIAGMRRRARQRIRFAETMLVVHLLNHEGDADMATVCDPRHLREHLRWEEPLVRTVLRRSLRKGWIVEGSGDLLLLTSSGRARARKAMLHGIVAGD